MLESIVRDVVAQVMKDNKVLYKTNDKTFNVETSARHVHLSKEHIKQLFGPDHEMLIKKKLSQPGQVQYEERITLIGPKGVIKGVAILGPPRDKTQVEISNTDARILGINPPVRESGKLSGSEKVYIASERCVIEARESTIVAKRHIHMTTQDALRLGVKDKQIVSVRVNGNRSIIFEDVVVRVNNNYRLSMHIDFDEGNAVGYTKGVVGQICMKG